MSTFIKTIKQNKLLHILSILIIVTFILLISRITFAYLAPSINEALGNVTTTSDTVDDFKLELGIPLTVNATPTTLPENGSNAVTTSIQTAKLKANSTNNNATYNYYLYLELTNNTFTYSDGTTPEIILTITDPTGNEITSLEDLTYGTYNGISGFDITSKTGLFTITDNYEISSSSSTTYTEQNWAITITYLNLNIDQSGNFGNSLDTKIYMTKEAKAPALADYITSFYTGVQGENGLYYHDSNLTNGANDNSYRYAGSDPNNYVCFGSDESTCSNDNLYRIIGIFDGRTKLIKYDYANSNLLGTDGDYSAIKANTGKYNEYKGVFTIVNYYYWNNYNMNGNGIDDSNTWAMSSLNTINLNTNYLNNIGSKWSSMIDTVSWKVGGNSDENISLSTPSVAYQNEIVNPIIDLTEEAKVGLMYASDYGFATDSSSWVSTLNDYNNSSITNKNWMYMGLNEWTISRSDDNTSNIFYVETTGSINQTATDSTYGIRPVFYLLSSINYSSGSGTQSDPIRIKI